MPILTLDEQLAIDDEINRFISCFKNRELMISEVPILVKDLMKRYNITKSIATKIVKEKINEAD